MKYKLGGVCSRKILTVNKVPHQYTCTKILEIKKKNSALFKIDIIDIMMHKLMNSEMCDCKLNKTPRFIQTTDL